jgi:pimeloyl-ACP methyl ester carboxylesterase
MPPVTKYVQNGNVGIAYHVMGDGPLDLLIVPGFISHLEHAWEDAGYTRFLQRLASFSRLIRFDKRGTGLSDRVAEMPPSSSAWTTSASLWMRLARSAPPSSASPRAAR